MEVCNGTQAALGSSPYNSVCVETHDWLVQVIPVMEIPGLGNMAAKTLCDDWKIKTQGDKKLEEAKKIVYLKGFNEGVMVVGNYKGRKVALHTSSSNR